MRARITAATRAVTPRTTGRNARKLAAKSAALLPVQQLRTTKSVPQQLPPIHGEDWPFAELPSIAGLRACDLEITMTPSQIYQAFEKIQRRNLMAGLLVPVPAVLTFLFAGFSAFTDPAFFAAAFLPAILVVAWVHGVNWRCPSCNAWLGRFFNVKSCPSCNAELRPRD